jgi:hypothetical protein
MSRQKRRLGAVLTLGGSLLALQNLMVILAFESGG